MQVDYDLPNIPKKECNLFNQVWIDRGIMLTIIYYLTKYYNKIKNKNIIIENKLYRNFAGELFPELLFSKYKKDNPNNFYFNIRKIIKNKDIIIDYLKSYDTTINTKKINVIPWYDANDPIVAYKYNKKYKAKTPYSYLNFMNNFSKCRRENYTNGIVWDVYMENKILKKYSMLKSLVDMQYIYSIFTKYIEKDHIKDIKQIDPVINNINNFIFPNEQLIKNYQSKIKTMEQSLKEKPKVEYVKDEENINDLMKLLNDKIKTINSIIEK